MTLRSFIPLKARTGIAGTQATRSAHRSRGGVLIMNKTARFSLVTTAIALGTLYAGAWRAEADFIQTNLVSDIAISPPSPIHTCLTLGVFPTVPRAPFGFRTSVPAQPLSTR